jgi:hypothetical protein
MTKDNLLWGAERIRGELLKLGIKISKRTMGLCKNPHHGWLPVAFASSI